jgi:hypothetical protein
MTEMELCIHAGLDIYPVHPEFSFKNAYLTCNCSEFFEITGRQH